MKDKEFLIWIHERLEHVHGDSHLMDFMHKFRAIISATPKEQDTPPAYHLGKNSLTELENHLNETSIKEIF